MKILVVSDIHGRFEQLTNAIEKFEQEKYDLLIQLGDLSDSFDRSNEDILRCFFIARDAKEKYGDKYIQLIGNHSLHYMFDDQLCSGYRADLNAQLFPWLQENKSWFQVAYQIDNYLFTHAGVQRKWFEKHVDLLSTAYGNLIADKLNNLFETGKGKQALFEVGTRRGGSSGCYGGPLWCDKVEIESYGPIKGYHQIVGHTQVPFIERIERFEGGKHYNNTSVTFCDVLHKQEQFLTLNI